MEVQSVKHSSNNLVLPLIIFSQFAGGSMWFVGNAVLGDLQKILQLNDDALGDISSAVQLGFLAGTLVFSILSIADRFSPAKVFLWSTIFAGLAVTVPTFNVDFGPYFWFVILLSIIEKT